MVSVSPFVARAGSRVLYVLIKPKNMYNVSPGERSLFFYQDTLKIGKIYIYEDAELTQSHLVVCKC